MNTEAFMRQYWACVAQQDEEELRRYFCKDACVRWHNTEEQFDVEGFLRANCDYPGTWHGEVERFIQTENVIITAVHVWAETASFHVVSFFALEDGKIKSLDEYWGEDGAAPQWRQDRHLGRPFR